MLLQIEGNIGAGKSTLMEALKTKINDVHFKTEPVDAWTLLPAFYAEPTKYALALQAQIITSYCTPVDSTRVTIMERSALSAQLVFLRTAVDNEQVRRNDAETLMHLAASFPVPTPDCVVYVYVPPNDCMVRIRERNRVYEAGITLEYLEQIEGAYQRMLRLLQKSNTCPAIVMDATGATPDQVAAAVYECIKPWLAVA